MKKLAEFLENTEKIDNYDTVKLCNYLMKCVEIGDRISVKGGNQIDSVKWKVLSELMNNFISGMDKQDVIFAEYNIRNSKKILAVLGLNVNI